MLQPAYTPLPSSTAAGSVSVLSFNVLIPNSSDGWWVYKYYGNDTPIVHTTWAARQALLSERLRCANADIVMLQETVGESFATDWTFMQDLGYVLQHNCHRQPP